MKKLLVLILTTFMLLSLVACDIEMPSDNNDNKSSQSSNNNNNSLQNSNDNNNSLQNSNDNNNSLQNSNNNSTTEIWTKEEVQDIIQIHDIYVDDIDSAEGVDMRISWTNTSDKTIKYIYFYVEPYNAVGDKVYCEIRDYSRFTARVTGPCESGYKGYYTVGDESIGDIYHYGNLWEKCWYNGSVDTIKLLGVKIIYMDGSETELNESAVSMAFAQYPNYSNKKTLYHKEMVDYYAEGNCQIFALSMYNMAWISFAEEVNVDIEIVNAAGVKVYSSGYIVRENNFFTSDYFGTEALTWGLIIENSEITKGTKSTGKLYFRVFKDDLSIDFSGELSISNLPT